MNPKFWLSVAFLKSRIGESQAASQCQTTEKSIGGMFLRGRTFKSCNVELPECFIRCEEEVTCQSFNFAIGQKAWEMNNRTKDARPEDFMPHPIRLYMKRANNSWCSSIALVFLFFVFFALLHLSRLKCYCFSDCRRRVLCFFSIILRNRATRSDGRQSSCDFFRPVLGSLIIDSTSHTKYSCSDFRQP